MTLKHDLVDAEADSDAGFHVYLHEPRESFTEHGILSTGRIEYLKMEANEEIELKLTVQHFTQVNNKDEKGMELFPLQLKNKAAIIFIQQFRGRGSSCSDNNMKSLSIVS